MRHSSTLNCQISMRVYAQGTYFQCSYQIAPCRFYVLDVFAKAISRCFADVSLVVKHDIGSLAYLAPRLHRRRSDKPARRQNQVLNNDIRGRTTDAMIKQSSVPKKPLFLYVVTSRAETRTTATEVRPMGTFRKSFSCPGYGLKLMMDERVRV